MKDFLNVYKQAWNNVFEIELRASMKEYWVFILTNWAIFFVLAALNMPDAVLGVIALAMIVLFFCASIRRLHDTNHSGFWVLINCIPLGTLVLLFLLLKEGDRWPNKFGKLGTCVYYAKLAKQNEVQNIETKQSIE